MRLLMSPSAVTGKISTWLTSTNHSQWLPHPQCILGKNVHREIHFQEIGIHTSRRARRLSRWSWSQSCTYESSSHTLGRTFSSNCSASHTLFGEVDSHKGMWVDLSKPGKDGLKVDQLSEEEFNCLLKDSLEIWRGQGVTSTWIHFNLDQGKYLSVASKYGFSFHHAEGNRATIVLWMDKSQKSKIPMFATHQVGVSGIVIREETKEALVVQDKNRAFRLWKFPGGLSELGEDISTTAEREVFEETGLKTEFQSVLAFRQHHSLPGAFGRSDMYVICRLKPLTFDLHPCEEEIAACKWMTVEELKSDVQVAPMTRKLADLLSFGLENGFHHVDVKSYEMTSLYKGLQFHIFHRQVE